MDDGCIAIGFRGLKKRKAGRKEIRQFPVSEAVPGFWLMVEEKFGITR
ncbi:hypothetical protein GCM10011609_64650 [Lentzea pudingi]|uniref:Uncharacterized protein n=1 Tax=Lentzea pudingi TaxID=1789439 RepID=A0ABQ2IKD2_9PSEU|nr:hypothetical protein [Lentzea pudingi]GGN15147.1 hypothetical protein GCM10011609_64650 [Lentzea pudingi]